MADQEVKIRITTDASAGVAGVDKMKSSLKTLESESQSFAGKIKQHWLGMTAAVAGAYVTLNKAWNLAAQAAQYEQSKQAFKSMTISMGADAEKLFATLRAKSAELIDDKTLIEAANRAMSLGIPVEKLGNLMDIARAKARDMGITTAQAFNDIITGVGRASPKILDNLGLMLKVGTANEEMAKSVGKTVQELTDKEKQMAILNATIDAGKESLERYNLAQLSTKEKMEKLTATVGNLQLYLGQVLIRAAAGGIGILQSMAAAALKLSQGLFKVIEAYARMREFLALSGESRKYFSAMRQEYKSSAEAAAGAAGELWQKAKDNYSAMTASAENLAGAMPEVKNHFEEAGNAAAGAAGKVKGLTDAEKEHLKLLAEAKRLYTATRTPLEAYNITMERLNMLLKRGYIDYDLFSRAAAQAKEALDAANPELKEHKEVIAETKSSYDELKDAIEGWGKQSAAAIVDFCATGKGSFTDLINSIIKDIARMLVYKNIIGPLFNMAGGGGGWFSGITSIFGGVNTSIPAGVGLWHSGGVVGYDHPPTRDVNPALFVGAPRLHQGLKPDEYPAILQRGEIVLPRGQSNQTIINIPLTVNGANQKQAAELRRELENFLVAKIRSWA